MTMAAEEHFEPQIVAFCCRHCAYAAADLAGSTRLSYPTSLKILELPCTGRADMLQMLRTLEEGADGVLVAGCLPGTCHYMKGNLHARQRVDYVRGLLPDIGLDSERVRMVNVSAAMGGLFAELAAEFAETVKTLGPNPAAGGRRGATLELVIPGLEPSAPPSCSHVHHPEEKP
jgi:F420-non-reducing hydrogenase iron-sulfur subunit